MKYQAAILCCVLGIPAARAVDWTVQPQVRPIFPPLSAVAEYWHEAVTVLDVRSMDTRVVCGQVGTFGPYCIFAVRAEQKGKLVQHTYFRSRDWREPHLETEGGVLRVVMPSGAVLLEIPKAEQGAPALCQ